MSEKHGKKEFETIVTEIFERMCIQDEHREILEGYLQATHGCALLTSAIALEAALYQDEDPWSVVMALRDRAVEHLKEAETKFPAWWGRRPPDIGTEGL